MTKFRHVILNEISQTTSFNTAWSLTLEIQNINKEWAKRLIIESKEIEASQRQGDQEMEEGGVNGGDMGKGRNQDGLGTWHNTVQGMWTYYTLTD